MEETHSDYNTNNNLNSEMAGTWRILNNDIQNLLHTRRELTQNGAMSPQTIRHHHDRFARFSEQLGQLRTLMQTDIHYLNQMIAHERQLDQVAPDCSNNTAA